MNTRNKTMKLSSLALAVASALITMQAHAEGDDDATALKMPSNSVEVGGTNISKSAAKFGEYSGFNKEGGYLNLNIDARGGNGYSNNEGGGTLRWSVLGTDLGLTSRTFGASISDQGKWNLSVGFDELQHNITDSYQTPYQGSMGGNRFALPSGFGTATNTTALNTTQKAAYHTEDIHSTRQNTSFSAGLLLNPNFSLNFDFNHLDQSGAKLMAFGSSSVGGAGTEKVSILPMPTKYQTETVNLALNWMGEKGHLTTSYYGSFFHDSYDRVAFQTWNTANAMQTMSTAPSNELHQLNLDGNYALTSKTKLTGNYSYGRNTQNEAFNVDQGMLVSGFTLPTASLNGLVITQNANLKVTDQTFKNLTLSAGLKYNERDNQTPSNVYRFYALDGASHPAYYPNTPLSTKKTDFDLSGDYRIKRDHIIHLGYTHEEINRWCNQYAVAPSYPAGSNCVVATSSTEDKIDTTYKLRATEDLDFRLGYGYGKRKTDSDRYARTSFVGNNNGLGTGSTTNGYGGINGGDYYGFYPYFDASRTQQLVKANTNWQISEKWSLGLGGRFTDDRYDDSTYGVQKGNSWSLNFDATYAYSDKGSVFLYLSQQHRQRDLKDLQTSTGTTATSTTIGVPVNGSWTNKLRDEDLTIGFGLKQSGLMGGKLELTGDFNYVIGKTSYSTQLNYAGSTTSGLTCSSAGYLTCGDVPDVKSRSVQIKLAGNYTIDRSSKVQLQYVHARLSATDYYYNGYQYGYTPTSVLATNQQAGGYSLNLVEATYTYNF